MGGGASGVTGGTRLLIEGSCMDCMGEGNEGNVRGGWFMGAF
jgi:hypothetical protein